MSCYKGAAFVREQIASILAQLPPEGRLVIRDDGSPDATCAVIEEIADARITLTRGENLGFARSFLWLLENAPADAEMVMLADQDDVWLPGKVDRAWAVLGPAGVTPTLYCSRQQLVDAQLQPIGLSPCWARPPSFLNALTENIVTGCTAALNGAALALFRANGDAGRIHFHDWWLYLVVSAFGRVVFDPQPTLLYRQHAGNVIGMGAGMNRQVKMVRFLLANDWIHILFHQVANLRAVHGARLSPAQLALLDDSFDPGRWQSVARLVLRPRRLRQTWFGDGAFRALLLFNVITGRGLLRERRAAPA